MKMNLKFQPLLLLSLLFFVCSGEKLHTDVPLKVEVREVDGTYRLYRNGMPFYIKGAGGGAGRIRELAEHGANSLRTWNPRNAAGVLDSAQTYGLTVLMGLDVAKERHGFDYDDETAVREQLKRLRNEVEKYRHHPALLAWGIGNELNLHYSNKKVWEAVEEIARMIHEVDGNHPVTTMLAGVPAAEVNYIKENCPSLDFLSVQMYADVINVQQRIRDAGWTGPYAITEWGATGHWEVAVTEWGAPVERTTTERAELVRMRHEKAILTDTTQCLGSYIFLWGQKQERTPTWYGLFFEDGTETESIDVMHYFWTGQWPENRCPQVRDIRLQGQTRYDNIHLRPDHEVKLTFTAEDPDNDSLRIEAELLPESTKLGEGGDYEPRPEEIPDAVISAGSKQVIFRTPEQPGAYRIFVYIYDGHNNAASANVPFYVDKTEKGSS